ncbi:hypothetical protein E1B28_000208 [Marasmius oreades]|uniref:Heparinase II/III family protein n=1 Tax=Marasmius oreades TaxID=181124 RepID=A0A9P7V0U3_9AGAR|nr:uncharacterized protein E1B28_000208 [Marasmius oreades]KAG7098244.1 hypothetical protein E1B28_000208 [Marasmius oreades]
MSAHYSSVANANNRGESPYHNSAHNESTGFIAPAAPTKKRTSPWIKWGLPLLILALIIIGAVLGGVLGSRAAKHKSVSSAAESSRSADAAASSAASAKAQIGRFAQATNSEFMVPIYPSTTNAAFSKPTFAPSSNANNGQGNTFPKDSFTPSNPSPLNVRPDRPRLFAPQYKWDALPRLIASDPYLKSWNETIFGNVTAYAALPPVKYNMDGASGILDNSREVKQRVKAFAYAYRLTKDKTYSDLAWREIQHAMSSDFGPAEDKWNTGHFLDTAEMSAAFGIAYDWLNDVLTDDQKGQMRDALIKYGLGPGAAAYTDPNATYAWWKNGIKGNWNCVCNSGLTVAALAILGDDTTGNSQTILQNSLDNAKANCIAAVSTDGTWAETQNYWYFGTMGHAEMASALITATGSDYGLLNSNQDFKKTGDFHLYGYGATSLFNYGDHGPNKFTSTANVVMFYASQYNLPTYMLFQRDRADAAEPWSMFWYDPSVAGAYWADAPLDKVFEDPLDSWVSMRSSFTDINALYVAMKAGNNSGDAHQNHNDLDAGDFVIDALGTRWAGELGSGDYLAPDYFVGANQDSARWQYYRKMTEGQNTILVNKKNQLVTGTTTVIKHESGGAKQSGGTTVYSPPNGQEGAAYWIADLTGAYDSADASSVHRGVRVLNGRKQVLIQDEVATTTGFQWRMHTNATVSIDGNTATLSLDGKEMKVVLVEPQGVSWSRTDAVRMSGTPPAPDQPNPGVSVLIAEVGQGTQRVQVLFNPTWDDGTQLKTPPSVALDGWSLTSHD